MGSQFVGGILSSGVEVELSKAIMDASKNYANQMELEGILLNGESKAALGQSNAVQSAEKQLAQVEMDQANTNLYQGITQIAGPVTQVVMRVGRERGARILGGRELTKIDKEGENIVKWKKVLNGGEVNIKSTNDTEENIEKPNPGNKSKEIELTKREDKTGSTTAEKTTEDKIAENKAKENTALTKLEETVDDKKLKIKDNTNKELASSANPPASGKITDKEMVKVRTAKFAETDPEDAPELKGIVEKLHAFSAEKDGDKFGDPAVLKGLRDDVEKKLDKAEESVNNRRQRYDSTTDRWTNYMQASSQATSSFAAYGGGYKASEDRTVQAQKDAYKTMSEYQTQSQKSAADLSLQGSQNSAQSITELARAKAEIAQANRM